MNVARYEVGKPIGQGGMGIVYEGWKVLPGEEAFRVAIKRIRPRYSQDPEFTAMFYREAQVSLRVSHGHRNLVTLFDFDKDEKGRLFLAMEMVEGVSLEDLLLGERLPFPVIRRVLMEALQGLAHAHAHGVIHRDISPCNILLSRAGEVKISDFGLATLGDGAHSAVGFKGKTAYASPEAIQCVEVGPCTDLYSLAAVMYQLLSGQPPFGYGRLVQINKRMMDWQIEPLGDGVPADLCEVVMGLLRLVPRERAYQSASEVLAALASQGEPLASAEELAALVERVIPNRSHGAPVSEEAAEAAEPEQLDDRLTPRTQALIRVADGDTGEDDGADGDCVTVDRPWRRWFVRIMVAALMLITGSLGMRAPWRDRGAVTADAGGAVDPGQAMATGDSEPVVTSWVEHGAAVRDAGEESPLDAGIPAVVETANLVRDAGLGDIRPDEAVAHAGVAASRPARRRARPAGAPEAAKSRENAPTGAGESHESRMHKVMLQLPESGVEVSYMPWK